MAEVIAALGVIASVAQLADYGFKLSIKLYTFSEAINTSDQSIKSISNDVSLTSTVLKELCHILKSDDGHVVSENAILATKQTVEECLKIFGDLDDALKKSLTNMGKLEQGDIEKQKKVNRGTMALERLKWPFKQSKMELLRSNLDRLKASLTLMLQVLSYARDVSSRKEAESSLQYQKQMIESLARSERARKRKYYALQHALEERSSQSVFTASINTFVVPTDNESDDTSIDRSISRDINDNHRDRCPSPPTASSNSVGELLLCFKILHDVLNSASSKVEVASIVLRQALNATRNMDVTKLEKQYGEQPTTAKLEAVKSFQRRLRIIFRDHHLGEVLNDDMFGEEVPPHEGSVIVPAGLSEKLSSSPAIHLPGTDKPPRDGGSDGEGDTLPPPASSSSNTSASQRTAALQAQIDNTVGIMRENINKVGQRGERLDSLQDRTDNLAVAAQGFRRGANRVKSGLLEKAYRGVTQSIAEAGAASYKSIQNLSETVYQVGSSLFQEEGQEDDGHLEAHDRKDRMENQEYGELEDDESVLDDLLSQWTTLPTRDQDIPTGDVTTSKA